MGIEVAIFGTATKDGEVRQSKAGNSFGLINLAISDGKNAEGKDQTTYVKVLLFSDLSGGASQISKGDRCYVEGNLNAEIWQPNEGGPRIDLSVRAFKFEKSTIGKDRPPSKNSPQAKNSQSYQELNDDLPF